MSYRVLVIGAVALGPKAACRCKRVMPDAEVTLIDQSSRISYGGCGIPYFISGEVNRIEELQETTYRTIRDADFFETHKGVKVLTQTRALKIDRKAKTVLVKNLQTGKEENLPYDRLVLALGSEPNRPPIPGIELAGITPATNLDEAEAIKQAVAAGSVNNAVVVGGGFIGLEMAVAFGDMWGIPTSVVEIAPQILPNFLSASLARMAKQDCLEHKVNVFTGEKVLRFEGENGKVTKVITDKREILADLVIMSAGIHPNTAIAKEAGLALNERGLIIVDESLRTSDPNIFSGGDCASIHNLITGKESWYPLGSMANRQGRVIGTNVAGGTARFQGGVGAWGIKLFEQNAAGAGLSIEFALREGYDAINVSISQLDRAHFYPDRNLMALDLVVDRKTRRILGIQGMSAGGDALAARINAVAPLLAHNITVEDISNLEVLYSPPFASAMDIINAVGNVAENILDGRYVPVNAADFEALWEKRADKEVFFLDTRATRDAKATLEANGEHWHNIPQDELEKRLGEIPKDKPIVLICNTGLRSYEAQLDLTRLGIKQTKSLSGGISALKRQGVKI